MTDKELLEYAAKAAGFGSLVWGEKYKLGDDEIDCTDLPYIRRGQPDEGDVYWNPLEDDGDALRLAVKLHLMLSWHESRELHVIFWNDGKRNEVIEKWTEAHDSLACSRLAIVRAAAEIGKEMK